MAVPKRKHSNSRSGKRRSHHNLTPKQTAYCSNCNTNIPSHVVCPKCGHYMGRAVVEMSDEA
ncbi:MAG: 50S ribosomal protein L32 [Pirellulaceae bacterium]|nr:50S ribosomal protein L32 [Pirellulaceae bacterium]